MNLTRAEGVLEGVGEPELRPGSIHSPSTAASSLANRPAAEDEGADAGNDDDDDGSGRKSHPSRGRLQGPQMESAGRRLDRSLRHGLRASLVESAMMPSTTIELPTSDRCVSLAYQRQPITKFAHSCVDRTGSRMGRKPCERSHRLAKHPIESFAVRRTLLSSGVATHSPACRRIGRAIQSTARYLAVHRRNIADDDQVADPQVPLEVAELLADELRPRSSVGELPSLRRRLGDHVGGLTQRWATTTSASVAQDLIERLSSGRPAWLVVLRKLSIVPSLVGRKERATRALEEDHSSLGQVSLEAGVVRRAHVSRRSRSRACPFPPRIGEARSRRRHRTHGCRRRRLRDRRVATSSRSRRHGARPARRPPP